MPFHGCGARHWGLLNLSAKKWSLELRTGDVPKPTSIYKGGKEKREVLHRTNVGESASSASHAPILGSLNKLDATLR